MENIRECISELIERLRELDIAEAEFQRALSDDREMRNDFRTWCDYEALTEKQGFSLIASEILEEENNRWETLSSEYD